MQNQPSFIIEDRSMYIYVEYKGPYNADKYKDYIIEIVTHPQFRKLPIIQRSHKESKTDIAEVSKFYKECICDYPYRWALWVEWQIYHEKNDIWMKESEGIVKERKMFSRLDEAENWIMGMPPISIKFNDELRNLTESAMIRIVDFCKKSVGISGDNKQ